VRKAGLLQVLLCLRHTFDFTRRAGNIRPRRRGVDWSRTAAQLISTSPAPGLSPENQAHASFQGIASSVGGKTVPVN